LLYDLEARHSQRSIVPERESDAFLAYLIEDLADEWITKPMYAFRWAHPEHSGWTGRLIAYDQTFGGGLESIERIGGSFEERQVGRNALVGCTPENLPMIEHIGNTVLDLLESHLVDEPFLFGSRPSLGDFGLFGQLSQFVIDYAAIEPCRDRAPYTMRWIHHVHDLSGHEGIWRAEGVPLPKAVHQLLQLAGDAYLPFLLANEAALLVGRDELRISAHGLEYIQAPFKYQARCLAKLREAYGQLSQDAHDELDPILGEHGCLKPLQG
jgi:glutathione S-transferase